jgi:integrase
VYTSVLKKWGLFCLEKKVKPLQPSIAQVVAFLSALENDGAGYAGINAARCALSLILPRVDGATIGKHDIVRWFIRSVYERRPPQPRYSRFWDVKVVFDLFKSWPKNSLLSLKDLSMKLAVLLLLVTGQRGQVIVALNIEHMDLSRTEAIFDLDKLTKSNRLGDPLSTVGLDAFPECDKLCVLRTLKAYLRATVELRSSTQLLVSFVRPHAAISRDTLARWTLAVLKKAGVDTDRYGSHSTRGALVSSARKLGVSVKALLNHAGWKSEVSFARHYHKRVEDAESVAQTVLRRH